MTPSRRPRPAGRLASISQSAFEEREGSRGDALPVHSAVRRAHRLHSPVAHVTHPRIVLAVALVLLALWGAAHVSADSVTRHLCTRDRAGDPDARGARLSRPPPARPSAVQALRDITGEIFDWAEMARRALGRHWDARSESGEGRVLRPLP